MKLRYIIPIFILIFIIVLINLYPKNVEANNRFNVELHGNSSDTDGGTLTEYWVYVELDGVTRFNYSEFKVNLTNLTIKSVESLNGFTLLKRDDANTTYSFGSNTTYTTNDNNKLYFAKIVAKKINNHETCHLTIEPSTYKVLKTNNFGLDKEARINNERVTTVHRGEEFDYYITVKPDLEMESDEVTITDEIPKELEILRVNDGGSHDGQNVTWNLGTFKPNDPDKTVSVHVKAKEDIEGRITNKAVLHVKDKTIEDTYPVDVVYSDIIITKTANKTSLSSNEQFYYNIIVQNLGTGDSKEVTVEDTLNENLEFISSDQNYTTEGNKYIFKIGVVEAGRSKSIRINVRVKPNCKVGTIPNTAIAQEPDEPPIDDNEEVKVLTPNLAIEKTVNINKLKKGDQFYYQLKVTNKGEGTAINVLVKDTISDNFEIVRVSEGNYSGNDFSITYPSLQANESKTITIYVKVKNNSKLGTIPNTATAKADNNDEVSDNEPVEVVESNVSIKKQADKTIVKPGEQVTYTITVTNNGDGDAKSVLVKDVIDSHLEIIDSANANRQGNTLSWTIDTLAPKAQVQYVIKVKVKEDIKESLTIPNIATVKEPGKEEVEDEVDVEVKVPKFTITKYAIKNKPTTIMNTPYPDSSLDLKAVKPSEQFVYEIKVTNISDIDGGPITITDKINDLLTIIDADTGSVNGQTISWTIDNLASKASQTFYVTVEVASHAQNGTTIPNTAVLTYKDTTTEDSDDVLVVDSNVYIHKEASVKKVKKNDTFYYTLTIGNTSDIVANNLTITDEIPDKLTFERIEASSDVTSSLEQNILKININSLAKNETITIKVYVTVKSNVEKDEIIKNVAVLTYEDKHLEDDEEVKVIDTDIKVVKTSSIEAALNNQEYYYTITVTNKGEADAKDLTVVDTFDSHLEIIDSNDGKVENNTITWNIKELKSQSSVTYKIKVKVDNANPGEIIDNKVVVNEPDKPPVEDEVEVHIKEGKVSIEKFVSKKEVEKKREFNYTLKVTNESDFALENVLVTDIIDSNLTIVTADGQIEGNKISWTFDLEENETKELTITVYVNEDCIVDTIPNIAEVTYEENSYPSNEVIVKIVDVVNPQTGNIISYIAIFTGAISSLFIFRNIHHRKIYKI